MLPAENKSTALQVRQEQYLQEKREIIEMPEVQQKLTLVEKQITEAGLGAPVRTYSDQELVKKTAVAAKYICRDVGIRSWDNPEVMKYDATRFFQHVKRYFSDLSLQEIKMAFELAAVGELDEWLPKDKHGNADHEHYQTFSVQYYSKILRAFRDKKGKTWHKARTALPAPKLVITEEQKAENRRVCIQDIYDAYAAYQKDEVKPNFTLDIFINIFIEQGAIKEKPKPTRAQREKAYNRLLRAAEGKVLLKKQLIEAFHQGKNDSLIDNEAQREANNQAIEKIFKRLSAKNENINQLIK